MEYTLQDLKDMVAYIDAQLDDLEREARDNETVPVFDGRLLQKRINVMQAIRSLENAEAFTADMQRATNQQQTNNQPT
jgi:gamma-glutamyl:cysteine ligase YbdK (ATP-grasp superfamily)